MPTQYETSFTILNRDGSGGAELLQVAIDTIEEELQSSDGEVDYELEANRVGTIGYAHFSGERSHPNLPAAVRLEARLCTLDDAPDVAVQILTRFISSDGADLPEHAAGPPRFLDTIIRQFQCRAGISKITAQPLELDDGNIEDFARNQLLNSQRRLPIFLITPGQDGLPGCDPDNAQRMLQGVAQVAYCVDNAALLLRQHSGISTYGGAVRIYWPNCKPGRNGMKPDSGITDFYMPEAVRRMSLYEVQKACLASGQGIDIDELYSVARSAVARSLNSRRAAEETALVSEEAEVQSEPDSFDTLRAELAELGRTKRVAEVRNLEMRRQVELAQRNIERLTREKEEAEEIVSNLEREIEARAREDGVNVGEGREERSQLRQRNEELRARVTEYEKTISRLNDDNQQLRQRNRLRDDDSGPLIRLGDGNIGNVTTLNHALNVYRDPCRKFIVRKLRAAHGDDLINALSNSIELRDYQHLRNASEQPEAAIDIGDFSAIVSSNPHCFEDWQSLYRRMDDIRRIRNRAAHPPPSGLDDDWTQDSLRTIVETLETLGDERVVENIREVRELIALTRRI